MAELAALPNVVVKLSGLSMPLCGFGWETRAQPPGSDEIAATLAPWYLTVLELFGPERCMFAANWPTDRASCSYAVLWNAFKKIAAIGGMSQEDKLRVFSGNANRLYRCAGSPGKL